MRTIARRLSSLVYLARPLALTFVGIVLLSLGVAYLFIHLYRTSEGLPGFIYILTLQFIDRPLRGLLLTLGGLGAIAAGIWQLSGVVVIPLRDGQDAANSELVLRYGTARPPQIVVLSGGAGMLVLSDLGEHVARLTCIVPVQDQIEYYYRASGLFNFQNVYYVVPTPTPLEVVAQLDSGTRINLKHVDFDESLARQHVTGLSLEHPEQAPAVAITKLAREAIRDADAIVLGPGSLFESIVPNLLLDEFRQAVQTSKACKIYICNLMTEPGLTTGFGVGDHINQIKRYGGFTPDYVLLNAQRIEPEIYQLYAAANQSPVYLDLGEYEETAVLPGERTAQRHVVVEGSPVIEADLASAMVQYTATLDQPGTSRAVRVLRHDGQKLTAAILALLRRG